MKIWFYDEFSSLGKSDQIFIVNPFYDEVFGPQGRKKYTVNLVGPPQAPPEIWGYLVTFE